MTKNLSTRLSALELAVKYIEENYTTVKSIAPIISVCYNLQDQLDILAEEVYEKPKKKGKKK